MPGCRIYGIVERMILVTGYENPDLDVVACAYGYAEFLVRKGRVAEAGLFGAPQPEAQFVLEYFNIEIPDGEDLYRRSDQVTLVDTSHINDVPDIISIEKVSEVIDHRTINDAEKFINAEIHIEAVGSCATLIAEKFQKERILPSKAAAGMLYSAIISNTVNFMATTTTERDKQTASWLLNHISLPETHIHDMFAYKSRLTRPVKDILVDDSTIREVGGKFVNILQLEIVGVEKFVEQNADELKRIVREVKEETKADICFIVLVDIEKGFNVFVTEESWLQELLDTLLGVRFENGLARREGVVMRKQIGLLLSQYFSRPDTNEKTKP